MALIAASLIKSDLKLFYQFVEIDTSLFGFVSAVSHIHF